MIKLNNYTEKSLGSVFNDYGFIPIFGIRTIKESWHKVYILVVFGNMIYLWA
jgi:hypothetical protein